MYAIIIALKQVHCSYLHKWKWKKILGWKHNRYQVIITSYLIQSFPSHKKGNILELHCRYMYSAKTDVKFVKEKGTHSWKIKVKYKKLYIKHKLHLQTKLNTFTYTYTCTYWWHILKPTLYDKDFHMSFKTLKYTCCTYL